MSDRLSEVGESYLQTFKKMEDAQDELNTLLKDKNLSLKAKGFLTVIMALPEDWDFTIKGICSILKEGKTAIYGVVQELKESRYCKTTPNRDEKGLILGLDYVFYEEPYDEEPHQDYPHSDNRYMDNMPQLNTYENKENKGIKELSKKTKISEIYITKKALELSEKNRNVGGENYSYSRQGQTLNSINNTIIGLNEKNHI